MMLRELRDWAKRRFSPSEPPTREQGQAAAQDARESRARMVTGLQAEVRGLQQEITDLTGNVDSGGGSDAHRADLALLEKKLEQKQKELAKFQGRI